jgi:hypothetical protein
MTFPLRAAVLAAVGLASSACFRYVGTEVGPVPRGESVRVHLTQDGMVELRALSPDAQPVVTGLVMSWAGDEVMLRLPTRRDPAAAYVEQIGQDVRIPARAIVQLERRRVDPVRTGLATVVGAAAVGTAIVTIMSDAFGGDDVVPPTPDQQLRIPLGSSR